MYEVRQTVEFEEWLSALRDQTGRGIIVRRLSRIEHGNFGDSKSVGDGVSELRFFIGPGYRVYYTVLGGVVAFLLIGGDKDTQDRDIAKAKELAGKLPEQQS